jgi:hypothetical protein
VAVTGVTVPRSPVKIPQVYTAVSQFSFLPQPDYRTVREPSEPRDTGSMDAISPVPNQPAVSSLQNPYKAQDTLRTLVFEAPMRPLDVARNMFFNYTTTQSIKLYNEGCERLPGDPVNGKLL